jgi:CRP-like cAMP-binding protein
LIVDGEIVNEYIARAMPQLNSQQLLNATHHIQPMEFAPGATIMQEGSTADRFYIVTKGRAEVALKRPGGSDVVVMRPGPGEYFGEVELMKNTQNIATVRAVMDAPVEVIALDRDTFTQLLHESESTRDALEIIAERRAAENVATRHGKTV